ncbi:MAG: M48 family peptidase, partial [Desulfatitalea sp.]|nr:M48 family peptidase [Desulfatitalea sp.]NNK01520.1 M48 family peptidase [Desulfatitalea sp.]
MNVIAAIILAALVLDTLVNGVADVLNLKKVRHDLPPAFKGWYDPQAYRRSQDYLLTNTRFAWGVTAVDLA